MDTEGHCSFNLYTAQTTNLQLQKYYCIITQKFQHLRIEEIPKKNNK